MDKTGGKGKRVGIAGGPVMLSARWPGVTHIFSFSHFLIFPFPFALFFFLLLLRFLWINETYETSQTNLLRTLIPIIRPN